MNNNCSTNPKGNILIVDDLPDNLRLLKDTLKEQGYKVRGAITGAMALRGAKAMPTDLILLDVKLPDSDGYEVCKKLKTDRETASIPVIFLSALNDPFDRVKGLSLGGADYIAKPFHVEEVLARVETHLTIGRLQKTLEEQNLRLTQEIEERKRIEQALFAEKELAQVTLQSIGDAVITTDSLGNINYFNAIAQQLTQWQAQEATGLPLSEVFQIVDEVTRKPIENSVKKTLNKSGTFGLANNTILISRNGIEHSIDYSATPIRDRQERIVGSVIVFYDVTESRNLARQLSWQASHDPLTGLINRRGFEQKLMEAIGKTDIASNDCACDTSDRTQHTLCYLDLDRFKIVNDTCGHVVGDELLRQVTAFLQNGVRVTDTLARLGGDEFGLLLYKCPLEKAIQIVENLKNLIQEFRFTWENKTFNIGISIGVVEINDPTQDLLSVLSAADSACYKAKANGGNCVHIYQGNNWELVRL